MIVGQFHDVVEIFGGAANMEDVDKAGVCARSNSWASHTGLTCLAMASRHRELTNRRQVRFGETPKVRAGLALHARRVRYPELFSSALTSFFNNAATR